MSAVEDVRKVIQDLVAPDLKAIKEELQSAEKLANARHDLLLAEMKALRAEVGTHAAIQDARYAAILHALDVDKRLERLERQRGTGQEANLT